MTLTALLDLREAIRRDGYRITAHIPSHAIDFAQPDGSRLQLAGAQSRVTRALERNLEPVGLDVELGFIAWTLERDPHDGWVLAGDWRAY